MDAKVEEFCNISQGSQKIQEYTNRFTRMMRYAPGEIDSEKKKMYFFKKGLNTRLCKVEMATRGGVNSHF